MAAYMWLIYALTASIMWGFSYVMSEKIVKDMLPTSFYVLLQAALAIAVYSIVSIYLGSHKAGINALTNTPKIWIFVLLATASAIIGSYSILIAFNLKNATTVNLIEISYPFFTMLFAWILFKEVQINWTQALGGILMFAGAGLILWKS